jgi:hypothetical protein
MGFRKRRGARRRGRERAQRLKNLLVAFVVRTQLETVAARNFERHFEDVDRVESQSFAVQRVGRHDGLGCNFEVQRVHEQHGQLFFNGRLFGGIAGGGNGGLCSR